MLSWRGIKCGAPKEDGGGLSCFRLSTIKLDRAGRSLELVRAQ